MDKYSFQYCQKIVVFSKDDSQILLAKRKGEADFDGTFSFIGGKMETTDKSILDGLKREKNEETGDQFLIKIYPLITTNILFRKKDGNLVILPHYYAQYLSGEINLNDEYSDYQWVKLEELETFEPKISSIPEEVRKLLEFRKCMKEEDFVTI